MELLLDQDRVPVPLVLKTSERADGTLLPGRWKAGGPRGVIQVRFDLSASGLPGGRVPAAQFELVMN